MSASPAPESWESRLIRDLDQRKARELLNMLSEASDLSCEQAQVLLPLLVEADQAGLDTDAMPQFAGLLRHLDRCDSSCMDRYIELTAEAEALAVLAEDSPELAQSGESFLVTVRESVYATVLMLRDVAAQFRMKLRPPLSVSPVPVYSASELLFHGNLSEVAHTPEVTVSLISGDELSDLLVTIETLDTPARWEVWLTVGAATRAAVTDETGLARFEGIPRADLQNMTLNVVLLEGGQPAGDPGPSA